MSPEEMERAIRELQEKVDMLEFREEQILEESNVSDVILDYHISREQYNQIMKLMDAYREKLETGEDVSSGTYENEIYDIFGGYNEATRRKPAVEYHFCEYIAKAFMDDGRWDEVFPALYGDMPKYAYLKGKDNE